MEPKPKGKPYTELDASRELLEYNILRKKEGEKMITTIPKFKIGEEVITKDTKFSFVIKNVGFNKEHNVYHYYNKKNGKLSWDECSLEVRK